MQQTGGDGPRVRVVVVNWNSAWFTARCLRSLLETDWRAGSLDIVVVDNGSLDGSLELLVHQLPADRFPQISFIRNDTNLGFAEGCNRAMRDLDGVDYVALVNNDAVVEPGWLDPLVEALDHDPVAGAAAARLVLEPLFVPVDLELVGGTAAVERVVVAGIDATSRTQFVGTRAVGDIYWPMDVTHHIDDTARLLVPAGPGDGQIELVVRGGGTLTAKTSVDERSVELDPAGPTTIQIAAGGSRVELLNGIGTDRGADSEGYDRHFGEISTRVDSAGGSVPGFCGGGVLLRSEMLDLVGLFDPSFFAYYEDMDLSWRATRAGWRILAVPESVIRHAFGGSGGSANPAFFFLNYRNWLITVIRNADRPERQRALRSLWDRLKWALRSNVLSPIRHGRLPKFRLVKAWGRVVLAALSATPGVLVRKRTGARPGSARTDRVRGLLQPESTPGSPRPRPGGPLLVYLDLSDWFEGERPVDTYRASLDELLGPQDLIQVLPVRSHPTGAGLRRLFAAEMDYVLTTSGAPPSVPNSATPGAAADGPIDEVFHVHTSTPGTVVAVLSPDGAVSVDGSPIDAAPGADQGFAAALLARCDSR